MPAPMTGSISCTMLPTLPTPSSHAPVITRYNGPQRHLTMTMPCVCRGRCSFQQCGTACRIPAPYLVNTKKFLAPELPEAPLIVFINSKSGGHAGPQLTEVLYHTLGHAQVSKKGNNIKHLRSGAPVNRGMSK